MKEWRTIPQYPKYSASSEGEIRNDKTGRILKQEKHRCGYRQLSVGKGNQEYVHRLVASAFYGLQPSMEVDHINGNKADNRVENLRWVTKSQNRYAYGYEVCNVARYKQVVATRGDEVIVFESRKACAEYFHCHSSKIRYDHLFEKGEKAGWIFRLAEDIV